MRKIYMLILLIMLFILSSCSSDNVAMDLQEFEEIYNAKQVRSIMHEPKISGGISVTTYATSRTTEIEKQYGSNLVIEDGSEPIFLSVLQRGKDRRMRLLVYVDYIAQEFSVADGITDYYRDFDMKDNEELIIPIHINLEEIEENKSHRIVFILIPSPEEYAKDKQGITLSAAFTQMYQLYIGEFDERIDSYRPDKLLSLPDTMHYEHKNENIMLNTDISNIEDDNFSGLKLPQKNYVMKKGTSFSMNCCITNISEPIHEAVVFLTLDNKPISVNGKDFILMDLDKMPMSISEISFDLPDHESTNDVMGYVVYSPFENMTRGEQAMAYSSARFTVEATN